MERKLTDHEFMFGVLMQDPLLFPKFFWKADLTIPHVRDDLPEEWRGKQVISREQKLMFCDVSQQILLCTARKVAKTLLIERDVIQYGLINDRNDGGLDEALFFTPGDAHIAPVRSRIFSKMLGVPLFKMFLAERPNKTEGGAGTIRFKTGLKWHLRIEGVSGSDINMAGLRAKYVLGDEVAFGNWICHDSRGQTALPDARWKYCGVPNGVRSSPFFSLDQTSLGADWSRHKYESRANPLYRSSKAWERLIRFYGGVNTQGFITQALGHWGAETFSSFPPGSIATKRVPFSYMELTDKQVGGELDRLTDAHLLSQIRLPAGFEVSGIHQAVIGWDYGSSPDPAVMSVFYRLSPEDNNWYELMRLRMLRVQRPHQLRIVQFINFLLGGKVVSICTDDIACIQSLHFEQKYTALSSRSHWANMGGTEPRLDNLDLPMTDDSGRPITVRRLEWSHELFRNGMQFALIKIPSDFYLWLAEADEKLLAELAGTIERRRPSGYMEYMAPGKTPGSKSPDDHNTDSCRCAAIAVHNAIEVVKAPEDRWEEYAAAMGWAGSGGDWSAPWDQPPSIFPASHTFGGKIS